MEIIPQTLTNTQEKNFLDFELSYNSKINKGILSDINNKKIKLNILSFDNFTKYESLLSLEDFKGLNKYFKMFDTLEELEKDLVGLYNSNKIQIESISENNLKLCFNVLTLENNRAIIALDKAELSDKDKINKLFKENEEIKNELRIKDNIINQLENEIKNLKIDIKNLKNDFINFKSNIEEKLKYNNLRSNDLDSDIFLNEEEKKLVLNQISNKINSIEKLFSSKIFGADVNKLKEAYLNKPNLIFVIRTKKGKRFGAYSNQIFEDSPFHKKDNKAFLFSLNHKKIFKSTSSPNDIWKQSLDSIDFGGGSQIRIFYDFYSNKNYTHTGTNYGCETLILNGEEHFSIEILEIFQVSF